MEKITFIYSGRINPNAMKLLHEMALNELEKENSDIQIVYALIDKMEGLARENARKNARKNK